MGTANQWMGYIYCELSPRCPFPHTCSIKTLTINTGLKCMSLFFIIKQGISIILLKKVWHSWEAKGMCVDQYTVDEWKAELAKLCKGLFTIWSVLNKKSKQNQL